MVYYLNKNVTIINKKGIVKWSSYHLGYETASDKFSDVGQRIRKRAFLQGRIYRVYSFDVVVFYPAVVVIVMSI